MKSIMESNYSVPKTTLADNTNFNKVHDTNLQTCNKSSNNNK